MKLSISNIAWTPEYDIEMFRFLQNTGFSGLEIAPTRVFTSEPYKHIAQAKKFAECLKNDYGLSVSSMQSIWYGISENIFSSQHDRDFLTRYTEKAIDFAEAVHCGNLVFGCPKNRVIPNESYLPVAVEFFYNLGTYAHCHNTVIALEANPAIYNTNFINTTKEAFALCRQINNPGIMVNVDLGTIINNQEDFCVVEENIDLVNHIHISEPFLDVIQRRELHKQIKNLDYNRFVSIEMKNTDNINIVKDTVKYVKEVLG